MMTTSLGPAIQLCAFGLGCLALHATRAHAAAITRVLVCAAIMISVLIVLTAAIEYPPDQDDRLDELSVFGAI